MIRIVENKTKWELNAYLNQDRMKTSKVGASTNTTPNTPNIENFFKIDNRLRNSPHHHWRDLRQWLSWFTLDNNNIIVVLLIIHHLLLSSQISEFLAGIYRSYILYSIDVAFRSFSDCHLSKRKLSSTRIHPNPEHYKRWSQRVPIVISGVP